MVEPFCSISVLLCTPEASKLLYKLIHICISSHWTIPFVFRLADPSMVNFSPQVVLSYVNYVRMLEYRKRLLEQQERLRNATLEAQKAGKQLVNQGQQVKIK